MSACEAVLYAKGLSRASANFEKPNAQGGVRPAFRAAPTARCRQNPIRFRLRLFGFWAIVAPARVQAGRYGRLAQGDERFPDTEEVTSSNLVTPTKKDQLRRDARLGCFRFPPACGPSAPPRGAVRPGKRPAAPLREKKTGPRVEGRSLFADESRVYSAGLNEIASMSSPSPERTR